MKKQINVLVNPLIIIILVLCLFLLVTLSSNILHPYHVSFTEIEYKKDSNHISLSIDIFTDDLENAIKSEFHPSRIYLGSELSDSSEHYVQQYIQKHIQIVIDSVVIKGVYFLPTDSRPDRTIVYFELTDLPYFSSLTFSNDLIVDIFPDQQNIVEFKYGGITKKVLLTKTKTNQTWTLK